MAVPKENIPQPDPSTLTTEQMEKSVSGLRDILEARIKCIEENIQHHKEAIDGRNAAIRTEVGHLEKLHDEKFRNFDNQLASQDKLADKLSIAAKGAIDTAFSAAKEANAEASKSRDLAVAKSEAAATKQMQDQNTLFLSTSGGLSDKLDDLKDIVAKLDSRVTSSESAKKGGTETWAMVVAAVGLVVGLIGGIGGIIAIIAFLERAPKP